VRETPPRYLDPVAGLAAGLGVLALLLPWLELKSSRIAPGEPFHVWDW